MLLVSCLCSVAKHMYVCVCVCVCVCVFIAISRKPESLVLDLQFSNGCMHTIQCTLRGCLHPDQALTQDPGIV